MTAMPNDDLRVAEISRLIDDLHLRLERFGIDERIVISPATFEEEALADLIFIDMYRIMEEASNLSFETQCAYPNIPWTSIRGMRNRFAHEYFDLNREIAWGVIDNDLPKLKAMADDYLENIEKRPGIGISDLEASCTASLEPGRLVKSPRREAR